MCELNFYQQHAPLEIQHCEELYNINIAFVTIIVPHDPMTHYSFPQLLPLYPVPLTCTTHRMAPEP